MDKCKNSIKVWLFILMGVITLMIILQESNVWKAPSRAAKKKNPVAVDDKSLELGKKVYVKECMDCHGEKGKGDGKAAKDLEVKAGDLSNPKMWEQTDGELFWKITTGKKPMPSLEKILTEEERWSVVNYIRTLAPKPETKKEDNTIQKKEEKEGSNTQNSVEKESKNSNEKGGE